MEIMEGIDPNPDNYVAGAILSTSTVLVGCLLRLEPNKQTEVCVCVCACVSACLLVLGGIPVFLARYSIDVAPVLI